MSQKSKALPKSQFPWKEVLSFLGVVLVAYFGYLGIRSQNEIPIQATQTAEARLTQIASQPTAIPPTPTSTQISIRTIFSDNFDNINTDWSVHPDWSDFNDSGFRAISYIKDGKYYREAESNATFTPSAYNFGAQPIPNVSEKNFCLIFDARLYDFTGDVALVILAREIESFGKFYFVNLPTNSNGDVKVFNQNQRVIATLNKNVTWDDEQPHTIQISLQDEVFKIFEVQSNTLLIETNLGGDDVLSKAGNIRIGTQLLQPNQSFKVEIDNIFVYDKCPSQ